MQPIAQVVVAPHLVDIVIVEQIYGLTHSPVAVRILFVFKWGGLE